MRITRVAGGALLPSFILLCVLSTPQPLTSQQPDARPADQVAIDRAIEFGVRYLRNTQNPSGKRNDPIVGTTDNSNTHFAMLAVWAARKHDVPVGRSLVLLANRYRTSQGPTAPGATTTGRTGAAGRNRSPASRCWGWRSATSSIRTSRCGRRRIRRCSGRSRG